MKTVMRIIPLLLLPLAVWLSPVTAHASTAARPPHDGSALILATLKAIHTKLTLYQQTPNGNPNPLSVSSAPHNLYNGDNLILAKKQTASLRYCDSSWVDISGKGRTAILSTSNACAPVHPTASVAGRRLSATEQESPGGIATIAGPLIATLVYSGEIDEITGAKGYAEVEAGFSLGSLPLATAGQVAGLVTASPVADNPPNFDEKVTPKRISIVCLSGQVFVHIQNDPQDDNTLGQDQEEIITPGQPPSVQNGVDTSNTTAWTNNLPVPGPLAPSPELLGTWMRSPSQPANGLTQLTLSDDNGSFTASGDVVCGASICPTGVVPATTFATDAAPRTGTGFTATFQTIPVTGLVVGMVKDGVLSVKAYNAIPDGVVNPDGTPAVSTLNIEQFQKVSSNGTGGALRLSSPGRSARAWRDAARGAGPFRLSPMARLHDAPTTFQILGDWTATATATSGIARVSLQSNGSGLTVHAYGVCQPVPCDWQSSPGIGYAARLDSDIGIAFSAVFQVGPQEILVTGDLENTSLVVTYFSTVADDTQGPNTFGTQSFQLSQPRQGA